MENKDKITSSTTYDERRKKLIHKSREEKTTPLGELLMTTEATIHEEGIKKTVKDLESKKKLLKENVKILEKNLGEKPKMNPELENLKANLVLLQLIDHKENETADTKKKESDQLKNTKIDLEKIDKDLKDIKNAVGTRLKL